MLKNVGCVQINIEFVVCYIIDNSPSLRYKDNEINIK